MESQLIKFRLPDNRTVDIAADVADQMKKWRQIRRYMSEAGGFLTGYQDERSSNVIIDGLSHPFYLDYRTRTRFDIRDPRHQLFLHKQKKRGIFSLYPAFIARCTMKIGNYRQDNDVKTFANIFLYKP